MRQSLVAAGLVLIVSGCSGSSQPWETLDTSIDTLVDTSLDGIDGTDGVDGTDAGDVPPDCADADSDGVCDSDDVCPGFDDGEDEDADTVPDGCDVCPGGDDRVDTDGDTLPDACDCDGGVTCDENATCYNTPEGPECRCNEGFEGDGFTCTDIDECALGSDTCDAHATCTNTPGSYTCACDTGYVGDGYVCTDVNECASGTDTCSPYATCTNTDGSYTCACMTGYSGDGFTCTPDDHCAAGTDTCSPYATCTYTGPGTYTCTCNTGYSGDGFTCTPVDHCSAGTDTCSPYATCTYTGPGTYSCACNAGYSGDGFTCTPIDHCAAGTDLCSPYATCTFTGPGTYTCACLPGYTGDGFTCTPSGGTARILFVSDVQTDTNIPTALTADGHTVTTVLNDFATGNATLRGSLSTYRAVFWSATGTGYGDVHDILVTTNLQSYVSAGGRLFVTGYDSIASPADPNLISLIGGGSSTDVPGVPGAVISTSNSLTTGVVDIRGVTPTGYASDRDQVNGLVSGTTAVVYTSGSTTGAQWTLRTIGSGQVAYVSNGDAGPSSAHASWTTTGGGGAGAYNAAIRNFARAAASGGAKNVLFVSDSQSDTNIPTILTGDGHTVTTDLDDFATGNATLSGSLSAYDVVFWSATGTGYGDVHSTTVTSNLQSYVNSGGWLFVTGYDSIASPADSPLYTLLGGTSSTDVPAAPGAVTSTANYLNTGAVDIRGVTPTGYYSDLDQLNGLVSGVTAVVYSSGSTTGAQWTLRTIGAGVVAYVSNGQYSPSAHASWSTTGGGGAGAYNAAIRNFAFNAP